MKRILQRLSTNRNHSNLLFIVLITLIFIIIKPYIPVMADSAGNSVQTPSSELQNNQAETLKRLGIIAGYDDGSLHLDYPIKRSEFSTLAVKLMGVDMKPMGVDMKLIPNNNTVALNNGMALFKDVLPDHWAYPYVKAAYAAGYVKGYPDGSFGPDNQITFAEAVTVLTKALGYNGDPSQEWPKDFISKAKEIHLLNNIELPPEHSMTRGEICVLLYNSLTVEYKN